MPGIEGAVSGGPSAVLSASVGGGAAQATTLTGAMNATVKKNLPVGVNTIAFD